MNIAEIRAKYPSPRDPIDDDQTIASYCVGGALCLSLGWAWRFPTSDMLADAIKEANLAMKLYAIDAAMEIIRLSDACEWEAAWEKLEAALT